MSLPPDPPITCEPWPVPPGCSWPPVEPTGWPGLSEDWEQLTVDLWDSAAETVWALTGRRLGLCAVQAAWGLTAQHTCLPEPWLYDGQWYNAYPSSVTPCCEVRLDSPLGAVASVVEVTVDGEALPPTAWVLDGPERLLTVDGSCWPIGTWCEPRRMVVTWLAGQVPPTLALLATAELSGELVAPCVGATCRLPSNVTSVTRQGVTVTLGDPGMLLAEGLTGLPMVDLAIRTFNPARLPMRSRVFSPDVPRPEYRSVGEVINDSAACLLAEAQAAWAATGRAVPADSRVVIGAVAYDDCCEDGLLLVSIDSFVWFNPFPVEQAGQIAAPGAIPPPPRCIGTLGAYVTVHAGVCVPVLDARGNPPSPTAEAAAMAQVVDLVEVLMRGLVCPGHECWSVGQAALAGTEGGCLVGLISVKLDGDCDECTP